LGLGARAYRGGELEPTVGSSPLPPPPLAAGGGGRGIVLESLWLSKTIIVSALDDGSLKLIDTGGFDVMHH